MKILILFTLILTKVHATFAYIPPIDFILTQASSTTGRQIISIDQEVTFKIGDEEAVVVENWLIEGDKNLKVTATGKGLFKGNINLHFLYNQKNKTFVTGKNKNTTSLPSDFFEKYLFIRSTDSFKKYLSELQIAAETVRLSRADGKVSFAFGAVTENPPSPQIWIDQEDFSVRKIRLPTQSVITLSDVQQITPGLLIAKQQVIEWGGAKATVKIKNISLKTAANLSTFFPQNLDLPSEINFSNQTPITQVIDNFYKRFR